MAGPPGKEPIPLSAPGLVGPISITQQPISGPRELRRRKNRPYQHVRYVFDLATQPGQPIDHPTAEALRRVVDRKQLEAGSDMVHLAAAALHAMSARQFRWIDHWEVRPGGWLPLPDRKNRTGDEEPIGNLVDALESDAWAPAARARSFSVRLTDHAGDRADIVLRRVPRLGRHSITLDLWGHWTRESAGEVVASLSSRLPVRSSKMTRYQYAPDVA
jgi:hypothetical protein